jgi:hypothetical protein
MAGADGRTTNGEELMQKYEPESEWFVKNTILTEGDHNIYVDLGAAHPSNKSLTSFCRDLGWRGVAIDANPDYAKDWADAGFGSHFVCAVLSDQPTARFVTHENSFTSRISDLPENDHPERWGIKRIEGRATVPLEWILKEHEIGKIDLLTCDLEGHEFAVLQTLDWDKHQPSWVIAEYVTAGEGVDIRVAEMLLEKGYEIVHLTGSNIIYRRKK